MHTKLKKGINGSWFLFVYNADQKVLGCDISQYASHAFALSGDPS